MTTRGHRKVMLFGLTPKKGHSCPSPSRLHNRPDDALHGCLAVSRATGQGSRRLSKELTSEDPI
ncbi:hypothetical protein D623_10027464 [Myotis brandtii]|uniref:Uncharacterized protein n=1 Tax=Myotis brandtii TaxID=109478 RepID=S7PNH8_MYOBR|nr:hypothetical protein D623_10027464 [Myotis brandtii]